MSGHGSEINNKQIIVMTRGEDEFRFIVLSGDLRDMSFDEDSLLKQKSSLIPVRLLKSLALGYSGGIKSFPTASLFSRLI